MNVQIMPVEGEPPEGELPLWFVTNPRLGFAGFVRAPSEAAVREQIKLAYQRFLEWRRARELMDAEQHFDPRFEPYVAVVSGIGVVLCLPEHASPEAVGRALDAWNEMRRDSRRAREN